MRGDCVATPPHGLSTAPDRELYAFNCSKSRSRPSTSTPANCPSARASLTPPPWDASGYPPLDMTRTRRPAGAKVRARSITSAKGGDGRSSRGGKYPIVTARPNAGRLGSGLTRGSRCTRWP